MHYFEPFNVIHILNTKELIFEFGSLFTRPFRNSHITDKKTFFRIFLKNVAAPKIIKQWFQKFYNQVSHVLLWNSENFNAIAYTQPKLSNVKEHPFFLPTLYIKFLDFYFTRKLVEKRNKAIYRHQQSKQHQHGALCTTYGTYRVKGEKCDVIPMTVRESGTN